MKTVNASEFKAKCLGFIDEVSEKREPIIITKHGKPVGRLVPSHRKPASLFGLHHGVIKSHDDLTCPVDETWDADH